MIFIKKQLNLNTIFAQKVHIYDITFLRDKHCKYMSQEYNVVYVIVTLEGIELALNKRG